MAPTTRSQIRSITKALKFDKYDKKGPSQSTRDNCKTGFKKPKRSYKKSNRKVGRPKKTMLKAAAAEIQSIRKAGRPKKAAKKRKAEKEANPARRKSGRLSKMEIIEERLPIRPVVHVDGPFRCFDPNTDYNANDPSVSYTSKLLPIDRANCSFTPIGESEGSPSIPESPIDTVRCPGGNCLVCIYCKRCNSACSCDEDYPQLLLRFLTPESSTEEGRTEDIEKSENDEKIENNDEAIFGLDFENNGNYIDEDSNSVASSDSSWITIDTDRNSHRLDLNHLTRVFGEIDVEEIENDAIRNPGYNTNNIPIYRTEINGVIEYSTEIKIEHENNVKKEDTKENIPEDIKQEDNSDSDSENSVEIIEETDPIGSPGSNSVYIVGINEEINFDDNSVDSDHFVEIKELFFIKQEKDSDLDSAHSEEIDKKNIKQEDNSDSNSDHFEEIETKFVVDEHIIANIKQEPKSDSEEEDYDSYSGHFLEIKREIVIADIKREKNSNSDSIYFEEIDIKQENESDSNSGHSEKIKKEVNAEGMNQDNSEEENTPEMDQNQIVVTPGSEENNNAVNKNSNNADKEETAAVGDLEKNSNTNRNGEESKNPEKVDSVVKFFVVLSSEERHDEA